MGFTDKEVVFDLQELSKLNLIKVKVIVMFVLLFDMFIQVVFNAYVNIFKKISVSNSTDSGDEDEFSIEYDILHLEEEK